MVAAGPFTLDDDLLYQPLSALLEVVSEERPDVLILVSSTTKASLTTDGPIHRC
jgi:DNA polymerase alpha subunit B